MGSRWIPGQCQYLAEVLFYRIRRHRPEGLFEPRDLHNIMAGFIQAKLAADIVYYILAYTGRVVRKRYLNN